MLHFDVIIATRNRPEPLRRTLRSIAEQAILPSRLLVVDSTDGDETRNVALSFVPSLPVQYLQADLASAAKQRNQGAKVATSPIVFFLDDDIDLEPGFFDEILRVFEADLEQSVGGVSATITNMNFREPQRLNRLLLQVCLFYRGGSFGGKLIGPAVNFATENQNYDQTAQWLPSTACAYRREVFTRCWFPAFDGYSFAEDVHLSANVALTHSLVVAAKAKVVHHDLGASTHTNWRALGASVIHNRLTICKRINRYSASHIVALFLFEVVYGTLAMLRAGGSLARLGNLALLQWGKFIAIMGLPFKRIRPIKDFSN